MGRPVRVKATGRTLSLDVDCPHVKDGACTECLSPLMAGFLRQSLDAAQRRGEDGEVAMAARRFLAAHLWYSRRPDDKERTEAVTEYLLRLHVVCAKHQGWRKARRGSEGGGRP